MGNCEKCGKKTGFLEFQCDDCFRLIREQQGHPKEQLEKAQTEYNQRVKSVILTTAPTLANYQILKTLDIVTSECVYAIGVFQDFFISGGRGNTTQNNLREARKICLNELKKEAATLGANAVIAVDLDYSEISGGKSMLFLVASGTAVIVEKIDDKVPLF